MIGDSSLPAELATRRVKVYFLSSDGQWDDRGTGYVKCDVISANELELPAFRVVAENQPTKDLIVTKIFEDDLYQRQGDTIVTWTNPETQEDFGLSFQEAEGAQVFWELICLVHGKSPHAVDGEDEGGGAGVGDDMCGLSDMEPIALPDPEVGKLDLLVDTVASVPHHQRHKLVAGLLAEGFIPRLLKVLDELEGDGAGEFEHHHNHPLHLLFRLVRSIIMLNEPVVIERLLADQHVANTLGILEYDPDYADLAERRTRYRDYLHRAQLFKTAVPIRCASTLAKIHLTFRLAYLKDVVMARYIDDGCLATLRDMMTANKARPPRCTRAARLARQSRAQRAPLSVCGCPPPPLHASKAGDPGIEPGSHSFPG
mmetsp:Transcript_85185/g.227215  ORF Transcript_85185/g.227215 Transcript_85185/m.227215 type:complete len:371 (-) Transcript_85185:607-1719(-)